MGSLPQPSAPWRVPRARLKEATPAVLRFPNGQRIEANLQVISLTGGLLSISQPVVQGSQVKLMFLTGRTLDAPDAKEPSRDEQKKERKEGGVKKILERMI